MVPSKPLRVLKKNSKIFPMLHILKRVILLIPFCVFAVAPFAQTGNYQTVKVAPAALKSDFLLLRDTLQKIHPGLYRYVSKADIDKMFDSCLATIHDSMTVTDFYVLTSYAIAAIKDGHTNCRLPAQVMSDYTGMMKVFPAMVLFMHGRAFVLCCKQNGDLSEAELLTINGHSLSEIIPQVFRYISSDGNISSRKNWEASGVFPLLYNFIWGPSDSFGVRYRTKSGDIRNAVLQGDLIKNVACANPFSRPKKYLTLEYKPGNVAVLTVKTFFDGFLHQTGENFKGFLDSSFKDLRHRGARRLIIDIRGNQGGNDENGAFLYAYLSPTPFRYYESLSSTTEVFPESRHPDSKVQYPSENNFSGKVYFLTDGRSFSTAADFAAIAKSNNRGLFVGEETGGGYYGNTSGDDVTVTLPNTQITCRIPMVKYVNAVKKAAYPDRGVIPDHIVYPTISDFVENKDSQMTFCLGLIQHSN